MYDAFQRGFHSNAIKASYSTLILMKSIEKYGHMMPYLSTVQPFELGGVLGNRRRL